MAIDLDTLQTALLRKVVSKIQVDTRLLPPIVIQDPFGPATPDPSPGFLSVLKPSISIFPSTTDSSPIVIAPDGPPGDTLWPWVAGIGIATGALVALLALFGIARLVKH